MDLVRATKENNVFHDLEAQWRGQHAEYEDNFEDYVLSYREHSKRVIDDAFQNYFVYAINNNGAYDGFLHVNHSRIKGLPGYTLRALEIILAPKYDYEDMQMDIIAELCAGILTGLMKLSEESLPSQNVKIHMKPLDKEVFTAFAKFFSMSDGVNINVHGSWLVLQKNNT
jgi:hypothetical protein